MAHLDWVAVFFAGVCFIQSIICLGVLLKVQNQEGEMARRWELSAKIAGLWNAAVFLILSFFIK